MEKKTAIDVLNKAVSLEYAATIQYLQHSMLIQGVNREVYSNLFKGMSEDSLNHAQKIGSYIVTLGGIPTVEPAPIRQSTDLNEMLQQDLELEQTALQCYKDALSICSDDVPLRVMLEMMIHEEYQHVMELEKALGKKALRVSSKEIKLKKMG
jgi:bacterioferritin